MAKLKKSTIIGYSNTDPFVSLSDIVGNSESLRFFTKYKDTWDLRYTLNNPNLSSTAFGNSVGLSGLYMIVGSQYSNTGSAYIYNVSTGVLVHTLNNPNPDVDDYFGASVAISGNYAIVGAYYDDLTASDGGTAYIFNVSTGALVWTLNNPSPAANDRFGYSVAISGNYAIVGAWTDDTGASNAGSAYIYNVSTGALVWTLNNPSPVAGDFFGYSVAISGNYAIVGAYLDDTGATDSGAAYIYNVSTGALVLVLNNPSKTASDFFGWSVAISGNYAIVGAYSNNTGATDAGSAYIYNVSTGALLWSLNNPSPAADDRFGYSVAISGNYAIVGAFLDDTGATDVGAAYIYNVSTGALVWTLNNPTPVASDSFGNSVAISGNYAIVGAYNDDTGATDAGSAYIYNISTGTYLPTDKNSFYHKIAHLALI